MSIKEGGCRFPPCHSLRGPCEDVANHSATWQSFWDLYPSAIRSYYGAAQTQSFELEATATTMKAGGCASLVELPRVVQCYTLSFIYIVGSY